MHNEKREQLSLIFAIATDAIDNYHHAAGLISLDRVLLGTHKTLPPSADNTLAE